MQNFANVFQTFRLIQTNLSPEGNRRRVCCHRRGNQKTRESGYRMKIWSVSLQKEVYPKDLPIKDLIHILKSVKVDSSDCWMPETEKREGYAAINEAVRRLQEGGANGR